MTLTKRDLVLLISKETGLSQQDVFGVIEKVFEHITESLARGESAEFRNFGVFEVKLRRSRVGRNPKKPANTVLIPARKVVKFKMGKVMKQKVMKPPAPTLIEPPSPTTADISAP